MIVYPAAGKGEPFAWEATAEDEFWARKNHGYPLSALSRLEVLDWISLAAILLHRNWRELFPDEAEQLCRAEILRRNKK